MQALTSTSRAGRQCGSAAHRGFTLIEALVALVVLGGSFALALLIWILMKLMKLALWLAFYGVLIGGIAWAGWLLLH